MVSHTADVDDGSIGFLGIPSITVKGDKVVVAESGNYVSLLINGDKVKAANLATGLFKHFEAIHVIDLNGLQRGSPNIKFIQDVSDLGELWVDPGVIIADPCIDMFMAGAAQTIVSTRTVKGLKEVVNAYEISENIIFQIDYDGSKVISSSPVMSKMGLKGLIKEILEIGINRFILADYSRLGSNKGPDLGLVKKVIKGQDQDLELFPAVGITPKNLPELEEAGAAGAIIDLRSVLADIRVEL